MDILLTLPVKRLDFFIHVEFENVGKVLVFVLLYVEDDVNVTRYL